MDVTRRRFARGAIASAAAGAFGVQAASAGSKPQTGPAIDVIVIGAGVSGLQTAWLLEQQGARVTVLEGRSRVGGRVFTLFDQPGMPEMGFNSMGAGYARAIDAAHRSGVALYNTAPQMMKAFRQEMVLGGKVMGRAEWASSAANPFPAALKSFMPWELTPVLVAKHNPLADWADWLEPESAKFDIPMHDFLVQQGLSEPAIKLAFDTAPYYGTNAGDVSVLLFEFNAGWGKTQASFGSEMWACKAETRNCPKLWHGF